MPIGDINAGVLLGVLTQAEFTANAGTLILGKGQCAILQESFAQTYIQLKMGDGSTLLGSLGWRYWPNVSSSAFSTITGNASDNASLVAYVAAQIAAHAAKRRTALTTATYSTTSSTLSNVTGLSLSVEAGKTYFLEAHVMVNAPLGGSQASIAYPSGTTLRWGGIGNTSDSIARSFTINTGSGQVTASMDTGGTFDGYQRFYGGFTTTQAGTVDIQIKSVTNGNQTDVMTFSHLTLVEIG